MLRAKKYGKSVAASLSDFQKAINKLRNQQIDNLNFTAIMHPLAFGAIADYLKPCVCGHLYSKHKKEVCSKRRCHCPAFTWDNLIYLENKCKQNEGKS